MRQLSRLIAACGTVALGLGSFPLVMAGEGPVIIIEVPPPVIVEIPVPPPTGGTPGPTQSIGAQVADQIDAGRQFCRQLEDQDYAIDCLSDELNRAANMLPNTPEYAEAKAALKSAATDLNGIVDRNASTTKGPAVGQRDSRRNPRSSTRPLTPVETARRSDAAAEAEAVIARTETVLLRSADRSDEAEAVIAISQAVGGTTILLRSL